MFNPLLSSADELSDDQLSDNIKDVTKKYYMTKDPSIKEQLSDILNSYVEEQSKRLLAITDNTEDFTKYINVN